ncbi:methionyl-tRNA formyltransferase [Capsulimonas corticalis]|uniref:Methionyl-tRNA formyltransferase n=1 Tax=Capsulimonas corticalis TaxID=2219043 RepID=A0A402CYC6_9BACT|nr:methionyl-tRNA formyltransferase [Capsulimonas corticalis]BDI31383.1 methionyl-tRNA formyltransferase [Capsulimonas corticalis]
MQILFLGTSPFAVPALHRLLQESKHTILGVVTQPDRPQGRGGRVSSTPVKIAALEADLPVYQPEKVRAKAFVEFVREMQPDCLVVAAFGQLIPQRMLDIPRYGGINIHGSLLPRWRGAAPMQYSLMAGDAETGVTTMQMDAGLDTGDMLMQAVLPLTEDDNLGTIEGKLAELGAELLIQTLDALERGDCPRIPQDPALVTQSPSLPPDIGAFDWSRPARELHNLMRGVSPKPGAYTLWQGKRLKITEASVREDQSGEPGAVLSMDHSGVTVGAGEQSILLREVQPESKGKMAAGAWARGARISIGDRFESIVRHDTQGATDGIAG